MSRMKRRTIAVALLIATFVGAASIAAAAPASAAERFKPDICGEWCK